MSVKYYQGNWSHRWLPFVYCVIVYWLHYISSCFHFRFMVTAHLNGHLCLSNVLETGHVAGLFILLLFLHLVAWPVALHLS